MCWGWFDNAFRLKILKRYRANSVWVAIFAAVRELQSGSASSQSEKLFSFKMENQSVIYGGTPSKWEPTSDLWRWPT